MIKGFVLVCSKCNAAAWRGDELHENTIKTSIHHNGDGSFALQCFNCGHESLFVPDVLNKMTIDQYELVREKEKIEQELEEDVPGNNSN